MLIDGEWCAHDGDGYTLKVGDLFLGRVRQRNGTSIYADCWMATLNGKPVAQTHNDVDYAKAWVERSICDEIQRIAPYYRAIRTKVPPAECFWGPDAEIKWRNWKEDRAVEGWTFTAPTLRQIHAALKRKDRP